jgi:hypothetical protein
MRPAFTSPHTAASTAASKSFRLWPSFLPMLIVRRRAGSSGRLKPYLILIIRSQA